VPRDRVATRLSRDPMRPFGLDGHRAAWALWVASFAILRVLGRALHWAAVPYATYAAAGGRWLAHEPLYDLSNIDGFQYFPPAALVFAPLAWLGSPLGDELWRALGWGACALGMSRLTRVLMPARAGDHFVLATAFAIGPASANLANGQANLLMAALTFHATVELVLRRWWRAAALLAFGLALKPLMIVPLLLVGALYRPMTLRLLPALAVAFGAPFLIRDHAYLTAQYTGSVSKLAMSANPGRQFEDVRGLIATMGGHLPQRAYLVVRATAALGVLGLGVRVRRMMQEPEASFFVTALALSYLMLFNPRTLTSSYVMTGCVAALLAARSVLRRRWGEAASLGAILLAWSVNHAVVPFVEHWLRPLACVAFFALLGREVQRARSAPAAARA